jgi:hypothetical protein
MDDTPAIIRSTPTSLCVSEMIQVTEAGSLILASHAWRL